MVSNSSPQKDRTRILAGLIGAGIQASRTPAMHECEASAHGIHCLYQRIDLEVLNLQADMLPDLLRAAELTGFAGLNITFPCKQSILPLLTDISDDARSLGAVNTVVLRDGKRIGYNTDWTGFSEGFLRGLAGAATRRVVQLGAGGAGAATAYAMLKLGAGHIVLIDPDADRRTALAARLGPIFGEERISTSTDVDASLSNADGLIHATPTGMYRYPGIALPANLLRPDLWVAEIVYFPLETALLKAARDAGCRTLDGSWMAVYQAAGAFHLFSGLKPDAERMHRSFVTSVPAQ